MWPYGVSVTQWDSRQCMILRKPIHFVSDPLISFISLNNILAISTLILWRILVDMINPRSSSLHDMIYFNPLMWFEPTFLQLPHHIARGLDYQVNSMFKSVLVENDILMWLLTDWRLCSQMRWQPVRCQIWIFLLTKMDISTEIS